ncbi:hypothetical protein [Pseudophaeobacter leonis]|uniref:hypothetical protein n=1 Tax=Pseudophaeobacter leonis TaxID=1144477 RepID=UPI0009F2B1AE|nr:hypothetical protein [Pseudophaeobacter leonis]
MATGRVFRHSNEKRGKLSTCYFELRVDLERRVFFGSTSFAGRPSPSRTAIALAKAVPPKSSRRATALASVEIERPTATELARRAELPRESLPATELVRTGVVRRVAIALANLADDPRPDKREATELIRVVVLSRAATALASLRSEIRLELLPRRTAIALARRVSERRPGLRGSNGQQWHWPF